jgi:hypothetical protein
LSSRDIAQQERDRSTEYRMCILLAAFFVFSACYTPLMVSHRRFSWGPKY